MKVTKRLIPALSMLVIAAITLSSATYAWFSMTREATAAGMKLTATAPNNLLISATGEAETFAHTAEATVNESKIYPASSWNATDFFKLTSSGSSGLTFDSVNNSAEGDEYYLKYEFYLKTTGDSDVGIILDSSNFTVKDTVTNSDITSVRAAVTSWAEIKAEGSSGDIDSYNILASDETFAAPVLGPIVDKTNVNGLADGANLAKNRAAENDTPLFTIPNDGTVIKITVLVWFEGQYASCNDDLSRNRITVSLVFKDITYD